MKRIMNGHMTERQALVNQLDMIKKEMEKTKELQPYSLVIKNLIKTMLNDEAVK